MDSTEMNLKFRLADGEARVRVKFSPALSMEEYFELDSAIRRQPLHWEEHVQRAGRGRKVEYLKPRRDAA